MISVRTQQYQCDVANFISTDPLLVISHDHHVTDGYVERCAEAVLLLYQEKHCLRQNNLAYITLRCLN